MSQFVNFMKYSFAFLSQTLSQTTVAEYPPLDLGEKGKEIVLQPPQYDAILQ